MTRKTKSNLTRSVLLATLALGTLALAGGCYVETTDDPYYDGPGVYLADLEVKWRIQGSQSPGYCDSYGISKWIVSVRGPESRDVVIDCRDNWWTTENDLLSMYEGTYSVTVEAEDAYGYVVAGQSTSVHLVDSGYIDVLTLEFYPYDFGF